MADLAYSSSADIHRASSGAELQRFKVTKKAMHRFKDDSGRKLAIICTTEYTASIGCGVYLTGDCRHR